MNAEGKYTSIRKQDFLRYFLWSLCITLWGTICFILPDFLDNPVNGWKGFIAQLVYLIACAIGTFWVIYIVGCNKVINTIFLPLFGLFGAIVSFYRYAFHVTITPMIIEATLHTNAEEAYGVISWQLLCWVGLNVLISIFFCRIRQKYINVSKPWIHTLIALLLGIGYFTISPRLHNSLCQRYPYNIPYNIHNYISLRRSITNERIVPLYKVEQVPDSLTIVLILGEAARADHLQLNGYPRETTPCLCARRNVISFPNIYSKQTHTLASLPYILTRADSVYSERQFTETSFVSILHKEHFRTAWISNQDYGTTFTPLMAECDTILFANAGKSTYVFSSWLDEELLPLLDIMEKEQAPHKLYILHTIGSHWYYNNHVPQTQWYFQPVTTNRLVTANSIEQITNSYDNTIRYMDYVVNKVIEQFASKSALILYQSDHGEALGEDNEYLHANETEMAKHPACFVWYSDKYANLFPEKINALRRNSNKRYRTDYVFYSILSATDIVADGDSPEVNIFRAE